MAQTLCNLVQKSITRELNQVIVARLFDCPIKLIFLPLAHSFSLTLSLTQICLPLAHSLSRSLVQQLASTTAHCSLLYPTYSPASHSLFHSLSNWLAQLLFTFDSSSSNASGPLRAAQSALNSAPSMNSRDCESYLYLQHRECENCVV